jgi:hypothetical protein
MNENFQNPIEELINTDILSLRKPMDEWAKNHLCKPQRIKLSKDPDGNEFAYYWLVTDHTGTNDSSYRVVYDEEMEMFGLECTLDNGLEWYMGAYGTFKEAIESM